jgi:MFS transporter, MHS family, proline/betaine transporter
MALGELPHRAGRWRAVVAISIGNMFEWFDFIIYGFFATMIARTFFPAGSETAGLLLTFASFGVTFVMRPFGAVVLGRLADRHGRKAALRLAILMMMAGVGITAFAPAYAAIGAAAPVMVVGARLVQGFSAGGEFGSATVFLAEQNPARRGLFASCQFAGQGLSAVLATGFGVVLTAVLTDEQLQAWGWRIPFLFGLLIGPVGYYLRIHIDETVEFQSSQTIAAPLRETLTWGKTRLFVAAGAIALITAATYTAVYTPTYAVRQLGLPPASGFLATLLTGAVQFVTAPIFGALSDRLGRLPIAGTAAVTILILVYPLFASLVAEPTIGRLICVQGIIGFLVASYAGPVAALICELFPVAMRTTAVSTSYSLAVAAFGGFAPFVIAWLIDYTGDNLIPGYYVLFASTLSLAALAAAYRLGFR